MNQAPSANPLYFPLKELILRKNNFIALEYVLLINFIECIFLRNGN
jgi:hypothetical protein